MPLPLYTAQEYLAQFQRLLPRGRVWHRALGLVEDADLETLMPTWARLHARLNDLIAEIFPCTTNQLLPEWEASLGLPDPCVGQLPTVQQRVAAVCAKFTARGGQSKAYYEQVAASLGFQITITEFAPFRVGVNACGDALYDASWAYGWRVNCATYTIIYFRTGISATREALRQWGNKLLECMITALKPAHTIVQFAYYGGGDAATE